MNDREFSVEPCPSTTKDCINLPDTGIRNPERLVHHRYTFTHINYSEIDCVLK